MSKINKGLFSSDRGDWETPQDFYDKLDREFGFQLDVCANPNNAKAEHFITPEQDSLSLDWNKVCEDLGIRRTMWMNPPYGREIVHWVEKAFLVSIAARCIFKVDPKIVCLLPSRTDTRWWHEYVMEAEEIRLVRGRLRFVGAPTSAPFPSCIVIFTGTQGSSGPRVVSMERE